MDRETLRRLETLNQLALTEEEKERMISFFAAREGEMAVLKAIDTESVERMVHVMPIYTVVREDAASQPYTREQLQAGAPDTDEGYWCVPKVLE